MDAVDAGGPSRVGQRLGWVVAGALGLVVVVLVVPALGQQTGFDDVEPDHVHAEGVAWIAANGVTRGCTETAYCPQDPVTRGQMASFMHRLSGNAPGVPPSVDAAQLGGQDADAILAELAALRADVDELADGGPDVSALEDRVAELEADNEALRTTVDQLSTRVVSAEDRVVAAENVVAAMEDRLVAVEGTVSPMTYNEDEDRLIIEGVNVELINGTGSTGGDPNGLGNLIIGYNAPRPFQEAERGGSHNLVVGDQHQWSHWGGIVAGVSNSILNDWASVTGGRDNIASGEDSSVSGGFTNEASGRQASVSGGHLNVADGFQASVSGGLSNLAADQRSTVTGGELNLADGYASSVSGGQGNTASGGHSSILGGSSVTVSTSHGHAP